MYRLHYFKRQVGGQVSHHNFAHDEEYDDENEEDTAESVEEGRSCAD